MVVLSDGGEAGDLVIGLTPHEFIQAVVDAAVKKGLVPEDRRLDPATFERTGTSDQPMYRLIIVPPGQQIGRTVTGRRKETD